MQNASPLARHTALFAYCLSFGALIYQCTLNSLRQWKERDIQQLNEQIRLCEQYPMAERNDDVYYRGCDLSLTQARAELAAQRDGLSRLNRWSLLRYFE